MILTKEAIKKEFMAKNIVIKPYNPKNLGPASYDLTLDNIFRVFLDNNFIFPIKNNSDYKKITKEVKTKDFLELNPGEFVLGITREKITLPENIAGILTGRSRFARLGLLVHITASFVQPGVNNKQVLEIKNVSNKTFRIYPGTRIMQIVFVRCEGKAAYKGIFKEQINP